MKCEKCGSTKFYIRSVDITYNNDFSKLSKEEMEENLANGNYINFVGLKGTVKLYVLIVGLLHWIRIT